MYLSGRKIQSIPKKYSENFVDYSHLSKNGMTESVSTQKVFCTIVAYSKPLFEKNGIGYVELALGKVENQTIIYEKTVLIGF